MRWRQHGLVDELRALRRQLRKVEDDRDHYRESLRQLGRDPHGALMVLTEREPWALSGEQP